MNDDTTTTVVPLLHIDAEQALSCWRWLVPTSMHPWFATALGDLFMMDEATGVWRLDVGLGELERVAASREEFLQLAADPENHDCWFGPHLVNALRVSGLKLDPGECYSYVVLPILGGRYSPENYRKYDVPTHLRVWGPIHEQLREVPDGSVVRFQVNDAV